MTYGRAELADQVGRNEAPVLLVTGDSGIGKSTVLALAAEDRSEWRTNSPLTLPISSGGLYPAFLDGLGEILAEMVNGGLGEATLGEKLVATANRLADERASVLGRVAMAEMVALIRGRVGDDAGKAISNYAKGIWPDTANMLAAKAAQARDPLAVEVLSAFAVAAVELDEGTRLAIFLDQGERLSEDGYMVIRQTFSTITVDMHFDISDSQSRSAAVLETNGRYSLWWSYLSVAYALEQEGNPPHRGGAELVVSLKPSVSLAGDYWTERKTRGRMTTGRRSKNCYDSYKSALVGEFK